MQDRPLAIDLFAGCGGMSLGLEAAGFDLAAAVEIDPIHCLVHYYNFPDTVTICQDITQVKSDDLLAQIQSKGYKAEIDLIAGGPPCQGFSLIGKRQLDDARNKLVFEYLRIIKEIKPKYFLFENVPGIATGKHQLFLTELIEEFEQNGYRVVAPFQVLDAANFGAPQTRKRLILIGHRQDLPPSRYPQPIYLEKSNDLKPIMTVENAIRDLANLEVFTDIDRGVDSKKLDYSGLRESYALKPQNQFSRCHYRQLSDGKVWGHIGSKHEDKSIERFARTPPGKREKISRFFRLSPDGLCHTLRAGTGSDKGAHTAPRPIHYQYPRCISIREAARLHTFPDWFQFHRTILHGFREIGNAVVPFLAKSLGEEIIKCLEIDINGIERRKLEGVSDEILSFRMNQAANFWQVAGDRIPKRKRLKPH